MRLHYRMLHRLARVSGLFAVSDTIIRHAAVAVDARLGRLPSLSPATLAKRRSSRHSATHVPWSNTYVSSRAPGVIGTVMRSRKPLYTTTGDRLTGARRPRYHTSSFVAVPILGDREVLGAICVTDRRGDQAFARRDVAALRLFASGAALALERERALDSAEAHAHAATVDPVTGVFNRRYIQVRLDEELQRSQRHQSPLALLMIDIDDFKRVNDSHGHLAGDTILRDVGDILRRSVRVFDVCARFGGEEFVIIMPGSTSENAMRIAERIRERIEHWKSKPYVIYGLSSVLGLPPFYLTVIAAGAMQIRFQAFLAKRAGKNCIRGDGSMASGLDRRGLTRDRDARLSERRRADLGRRTRDRPRDCRGWLARPPCRS